MLLRIEIVPRLTGFDDFVTYFRDFNFFAVPHYSDKSAIAEFDSSQEAPGAIAPGACGIIRENWQ